MAESRDGHGTMARSGSGLPRNVVAFQPLVRPCIPTGRCAPGLGVKSRGCEHKCLQDGLGCRLQQAGSLGLLDRTLTAVAYQLPRVARSASSVTSVLPMLSDKHVLIRTDNVPTVVYINRQSGLRFRRMSQLARHLLLSSQTRLKSLRAVHIPGELNRGPVRFPGILPLPAVLCPDQGPPRQGRSGTQLAPGTHQVRLSPSEPPCTDSVQDQGGRGTGPVGCALLAHPDLVCRPHAPRDSPSLEEKEGPSSGDGHNLAPASRPLEPTCVASGWDSADLTGLPQAVINTIIQTRAPSTRQAYALKWGLFADWHSSRREDPQRCSVEKLERRLSLSTLKVHVVAIAAYYDAVDGLSLGKHHLIIRFLGC
ncbi:TPR and ankyrin repeat-containing protein 1 [Labeo rohita]|uniref:TPR and ankyrin repeat-containing protein 1 n=1 Tax=Labeo rohita TaxID=84645 RepID=A0ABQ8L3P2_LABRO|nr:TPR and ankyrin repeat-containing protein 1 [Labeo rohita]